MICDGFAYETHKMTDNHFIPTGVGAYIDGGDDGDSQFFPFKFCPCCGEQISTNNMPDSKCESAVKKHAVVDEEQSSTEGKRIVPG